MKKVFNLHQKSASGQWPFDDSCCILTNKGLFHVEQIVRGQSTIAVRIQKNWPVVKTSYNEINWIDDAWRNVPFLGKPKPLSHGQGPRALLIQGQIKRRANNTLPMFILPGLLKTCFINDLHIQELSILFCWGVHQGTCSSLVS